MKVLLIGGTGVLSGAVTRLLLNLGYEVTMINRGLRKLFSGVRLIKSDFSNYSYIEENLKGNHYDAVIDFLCYKEEILRKSFLLYSKYADQYFFISSCAVYDTSIGGVMVEDSPKIRPMWSYSVNKWHSEELLYKLAQGTGVHYTVIRPCVTYDDTRIPYGITPRYGFHWTLCARALSNKPLIRWNNGENRCNIMRVEDFAEGLVLLIANPKAYDNVFNICGDETPSFQDVLDCVSEFLNHEVPVFDMPVEFYANEIPQRAGELIGGRAIDRYNSNQKIKDVTGSFSQKIGLKEGISRTLEAYQSQNYQKGIEWHFDAETDRIIAKFCKLKGIDPKQYNIGFVDYLGNATIYDKIVYWLEYYKENLFVKIIKSSASFIKRIVHQ